MKNTTDALKSRWYIILLLGAVAVGGWLRFHRLDLMEFKLDEALLHELAVRQASGEMQLHGIVSSVGLRNPPMAVYLYAIPALVSSDPLVMAGLPALLGTAAVALTYLLSRLWLSRGASLCAAWLFAVSPWAVLFSRKIWAQDLLPAFSILFFLSVIQWLRKGKGGWAVAGAAALAALCQIHYSALALLPIVPAAFLVRRSRQSLQQFAVAAGVFAFLWLPFLFAVGCGEATDPAAHGGIGVAAASYPAQLKEAFLWQGRLMGRGLLERISLGFGIFEAKLPLRRSVFEDVAFAVIVALCIASVFWRMKSQRDLWPLAAWMLLPVLLLTNPLIRFHFHYMVICYPAMFIGVGVLLDQIHSALRGRGTARNAFVVAAVAGTFMLVMDGVSFTRRLHHVLAEKGIAPADYGVAYREKLNVSRLLVEEVSRGPYVLMDMTPAARFQSEKTYAYLYELAGGRGKLAPAGTSGVPVFVMFGPEVEGGMRSPALRDAGDVQLGPIRIQRLRPIKAGTP